MMSKVVQIYEYCENFEEIVLTDIGFTYYFKVLNRRLRLKSEDKEIKYKQNTADNNIRIMRLYKITPKKT